MQFDWQTSVLRVISNCEIENCSGNILGLFTIGNVGAALDICYVMVDSPWVELL